MTDAIISHISTLLSGERAFVIYKQPNADRAHLLVPGQITTTKEIPGNQYGFIIRPFNTQGEKIYLFSSTNAQKIDFEITGNSLFKTPENILEAPYTDDEKAFHLQLVSAGVRFIREGNAGKVVLSHRFSLKKNEVHPAGLFLRLAQYYRNSFVYLWYHPDEGIWTGATPEQLIRIEEKNFYSMALAGTRTGENSSWTDKEHKEHRWVVEDIYGKLQSFASEIHTGETREVAAGHLRHLMTPVEGELRDDCSFEQLAEALHPTPAVCGFPEEISRKFILQNEAYPREYYTGYLGEWNMNGQTDLYVNLRCMKIADDTIYIYAGGGIVEKSNPMDEWNEILQKAGITYSVLKTLK